MDLQNVKPGALIGVGELNLTVDPAGPQQRGVQDVNSVCGHQNLRSNTSNMFEVVVDQQPKRCSSTCVVAEGGGGGGEEWSVGGGVATGTCQKAQVCVITMQAECLYWFCS